MPPEKLPKIAIISAVAIFLLLSAPTAQSAEEPAPISLTTLEGETVQLADLTAGKPTLLVFWATWCGPCRAEIPKINEAYSRFGDQGLGVLAINPGIRDSLRKVRHYVGRFKPHYPIYFDSKQATRAAYSLMGTPTIILIDADGKEIQRGETVDLKAIERLMSAETAQSQQ